MKKNYFFVALILFLSSCVYVSQDVVLDPSLSNGNLQKHKKINNRILVEVKDKRSFKTLGRRGNGVVRLAEIRNSQDVEQMLKNKIEKILKEDDFMIKSGGKKIIIEIKGLKYEALPGFFTIGSEVISVIEVSVHKSGREIFNQTYKAKEEKRYSLFAPTAEQNEKIINKSFERCLQKIIDDEKLIQILSK